MEPELQDIFDKYFKYLTDEFGFQITNSVYDPQVFGNFVIELSKGEKKLRLASDRSQIFVELYDPVTGWMDKEQILEENGISSERYGSTYGLWNGFEIQNQSVELQEYKNILKL